MKKGIWKWRQGRKINFPFSLHTIGYFYFLKNPFSHKSVLHGNPARCCRHKRTIIRVLKSDRTGLTAALRYRFTGPVRPVTGGNRLNSNPNSNKFKNSHATGSDRFDRFTGRFYRFTGRFDRFEFKFKFKSSRATGLPAGLTGLIGGP